jgi:hypothetical protein
VEAIVTTTATIAGPRAAWLSERTAVVVALLGAAPLGVLAALAPLTAAVGTVAAVLWVTVLLRPVVGTYVLLFSTPLVIGIDRGNILPLVRLNEALLLTVASALVARWFFRLRVERPRLPRLGALEASIVAMAVLASVVPLLWMAARGLRPSQDDVLYSLQLWKYLLLYAVVRASVREVPQVRTALFLSLGVGAAVVVLAILQALGVDAVTSFMTRYYAPFGKERITAGRGSSTLASAIALGDYAAICLALSLGLYVRRIGSRPLLAGAAVLFALGALGSGQFSGWLALIVALVAVGLVTRLLHRLVLASLPGALLAVVLVGPVLSRRLAGFQSEEGVPLSWSGRMDNLRRFFWPELFGDYHWVLGVRPAGRLPAPSTDSWRDWVFIESGHTWLLWIGGVPLFVAFLVFLVAAGRTFWRIARTRADVVGAAAVGGFAAVAVIGVLMTTDAHLTMRGVADLSFALFALAQVSQPP